MGYPQKLLSDDETIEFEMRPHWRAVLVPGIIMLAVVFGLVFGLTKLNDWFSDNAVSSVATWMIWGAGILVLVVFVIRPFLYWLTTQYVFTNTRIIIRTGLVAKKGRDMPLSKVNNVSFEVSVLGRILHYGTLTIDSASDTALIVDDVPDVEHIQREINRLHEEDDERRRGNFSPPPANQPPGQM
jgi:uncharacterized membrane protein YdbT with pleckstrin-like domain